MRLSKKEKIFEMTRVSYSFFAEGSLKEKLVEVTAYCVKNLNNLRVV